jgi:hypothetical protein
MTLLPYWIQKADFSASDEAPVSATDAVRAFNEHDWLEELRLEEERERSGAECCPPGIGFVRGNGQVLHICPDPDGTALVHYHFAAPQKLFGFIPRTVITTVTSRAVPRSSIADLIMLFFDSQHDLLVARLEQGRADGQNRIS